MILCITVCACVCLRADYLYGKKLLQVRALTKSKSKKFDEHSTGVYLNHEKCTLSHPHSRTRSMTFIRQSFLAIAMKKKEEEKRGKEGGGGVDFSARREPRLALLSQSNTQARQHQ